MAPPTEAERRAERELRDSMDVAKLRARIATLTRAIEDCWYCARRYASNRSTYITSVYNGHTRALLALGVRLNPTGDNTIWARDGMGLDGLTAEERATDKPDAYAGWGHEEWAIERRALHDRVTAADTLIAALRRHLARYDPQCACEPCREDRALVAALAAYDEAVGEEGGAQ